MASLIGSLLGGLGSMGASVIGDLGKKVIQTLGNVGEKKLKQFQQSNTQDPQRNQSFKKLARRVDVLESKINGIETSKKRKMAFEKQSYQRDQRENTNEYEEEEQ